MGEEADPAGFCYDADKELYDFVEAAVESEPQMFLNMVELMKRKTRRDLMEAANKTRISRPRCHDYWDTNWGRMLLDP